MDFLSINKHIINPTIFQELTSTLDCSVSAWPVNLMLCDIFCINNYDKKIELSSCYLTNAHKIKSEVHTQAIYLLAIVSVVVQWHSV